MIPRLLLLPLVLLGCDVPTRDRIQEYGQLHQRLLEDERALVWYKEQLREQTLRNRKLEDANFKIVKDLGECERQNEALGYDVRSMIQQSVTACPAYAGCPLCECSVTCDVCTDCSDVQKNYSSLLDEWNDVSAELDGCQRDRDTCDAQRDECEHLMRGGDAGN